MSTETSDFSSVLLDLKRIASDQRLRVEEEFAQRSMALDRIDFIETVARLRAEHAIRHRATALRAELERIDQLLFARVRREIRLKEINSVGLRHLLDPATEYRAGDPAHRHRAFEPLDDFVGGLILERPAPEETFERTAEMVYYEPVPASVILELVDRAALGSDELFIDIGSGLGQAAILVHLLTGANVRGVEIEPTFVAYANRTVHDLSLDGVHFSAGDAREVSLAGAQLYFLFTPFTGRILGNVMGRLYAEAQQRPIIVSAFGPCVARVADQRWLQPRRDISDSDFRLAIFDSI